MPHSNCRVTKFGPILADYEFSRIIWHFLAIKWDQKVNFWLWNYSKIAFWHPSCLTWFHLKNFIVLMQFMAHFKCWRRYFWSILANCSFSGQKKAFLAIRLYLKYDFWPIICVTWWHQHVLRHFMPHFNCRVT